ncbi:MAG: DUF2149 domain-containing protein, partial [Thermoleophilia bacterium]
MPASDDHPAIHGLGTVYDEPRPGLRFMKRRRRGTADRNGDPLDGIVNLFDVAIVLAVGFLVAALSAAGVSGFLTSDNMTIVTNPGAPDMQVVVKQGDEITKLDMTEGAQVQGIGTLMGSFYRLADGTVVYVPSGSAPPAEAAPAPGASPAPTPGVTPGVTPAP